MKYGKYLENNLRSEWRDKYLDYRALKELLKEAAKDAEETGANQVAFSPRQTSLTVEKGGPSRDAPAELFYARLEKEVYKIAQFTQSVVKGIRADLKQLKERVDGLKDNKGKDKLLADAKRIGDEFLALEKFVNLNYMGFHKILKKHDKMLPHMPCRQFYISHLHQQPWVQGGYSDLLVQLSNVYSRLRGDSSGQKNEDAAQGFVRSTTKYWVRTSDVSAVKHHVLQHLPVFLFDKDNFAGDAQLINSVYLDNQSLELYHGRLDKRPGALALRLRWYGNAPPSTIFMERKTHRESWKGEESVKERFVLPEDKVVPFLEGEYDMEQAVEDLRAKGKSEEELAKFAQMFLEVQQVVDSKQLRPMVRTQYMRTAFQIPFDATVRISLDTNLCMIKENPDDGPSCSLAGRWYRDPALSVMRTEITRFPHAVLEVKLSLAEGESVPPWVTELLDSGYLTEVHKFSKFIHGTCTLMPDMVQAVPYWVDDESVRPSMLASAPIAATRLEATAAASKPRRGAAVSRLLHEDDLHHPLLGDQASLQLIRDHPRGVAPLNGAESRKDRTMAFLERFFGLGSRVCVRSSTMRIEPKTFFANERTFLSWLHMAVTIGSIASAMLGYAASADRTSVDVHLVEIISLILLPVAIAMCAYALGTFWWRASRIKQRRTTFIDDKVGPLALASVIAVALTSIMIISIHDFIELLSQHGLPSLF